jgi:hypothetical protein
LAKGDLERNDRQIALATIKNLIEEKSKKMAFGEKVYLINTLTEAIMLNSQFDYEEE